MRNFRFINVVVLSLFFVLIGCKTQKQNVQNETPSVEIVELPCQEFAKDDANYYRQSAVSMPSKNLQISRRTAMNSAISQLLRRLNRETYNDVEQICEKISITEDGRYVVYLAIQIKK